MHTMLVPMPWAGTIDQLDDHNINWLKSLPNNTYCDLWLKWPKHNLPLGYDLYVVSFHLEAVDVEWVADQSQKISVPIILLSDSNYYDYLFPSNVYPYTYYHWHHQTDLITKWFTNKIKKKNCNSKPVHSVTELHKAK